MKVVFANNYYGFGLSNKAIDLYCQMKNINIKDIDVEKIPRHDPVLVAIVESLGVESWESKFHILRIAGICGTQYRIEKIGDPYFGETEVVIAPEQEEWVTAKVTEEDVNLYKKQLGKMAHEEEINSLGDIEFERIQTPMAI